MGKSLTGLVLMVVVSSSLSASSALPTYVVSLAAESAKKPCTSIRAELIQLFRFDSAIPHVMRNLILKCGPDPFHSNQADYTLQYVFQPKDASEVSWVEQYAAGYSDTQFDGNDASVKKVRSLSVQKEFWTFQTDPSTGELKHNAHLDNLNAAQVPSFGDALGHFQKESQIVARSTGETLKWLSSYYPATQLADYIKSDLSLSHGFNVTNFLILHVSDNAEDDITGLQNYTSYRICTVVDGNLCKP